MCIPNGFIRDDGAKHIEKITFRYVNDDLSFGLYTNSEFMGSDDTLFNRSAQINEALKTSNKYSIKKEARTMNGIPTEMWLFGGTQNLRNSVTNEDEKKNFYDLFFMQMSGMPHLKNPTLIWVSAASTKRRNTAKHR